MDVYIRYDGTNVQPYVLNQANIVKEISALRVADIKSNLQFRLGMNSLFVSASTTPTPGVQMVNFAVIDQINSTWFVWNKPGPLHPGTICECTYCDAGTFLENGHVCAMSDSILLPGTSSENNVFFKLGNNVARRLTSTVLSGARLCGRRVYGLRRLHVMPRGHVPKH